MEWDFQDILHLDAMEWIARRKDWRQFFRFERKLARITGGHYNSALLLDPILAEATAKLPKAKNPPLLGFTRQMHLLTDIGDLMLKQIAKDPQTASLPRPLTAMDKLATARRQAALNRTIARFAPHHAHLTPRVGS